MKKNEEIIDQICLTFLRAEALADVFIRGHDGNVSAVAHRSLEERVDQAFAPGDVLLVVGDVSAEVSPPVCGGLLRLIEVGSEHFEAGGGFPLRDR